MALTSSFRTHADRGTHGDLDHHGDVQVDHGGRGRLEVMVTQKAVRYLGMEVRRVQQAGLVCFHVSQMGYTMDLLRQYEGHRLVSSAVPVTRDTILENHEDEDADDEQDPEQVHRAQKLGGELL